MLAELSIQDVALFERAQLTFGPGLNVVTGETGAGKSLVVGALEMLLGERPRARLLRRGAKSARVDGRFVFAADAIPPRLAGWLAEHAPDREAEDEGELELVLSRAIGADGRTRAWLDSRPVTRRTLRELAGMLVEIHGQNDHQLLFEPDEQRRLVDLFGEHGKALASYRARRDTWRALADRLERHREERAARRDRADLLRFQLAELAEVELGVGELDELRAERETLRHAAALGSELGAWLDTVSEGDAPALDALRRGEPLLDRWAERVPALEGVAGELREAALHLEEACGSLRGFLDGLEVSPGRLEEVERRLAAIERLERKHHVVGDELVATQERLARELEALEGAGESYEELETKARDARAKLARGATALRSARRALRPKLAREVERRLAELGLERARVELSVEPTEADALDDRSLTADRARFGPDGTDDVELLFAANPGEGAQPLRKVASGGEAARVMLALRGALAARQTIPSLVFDEVDAGVGGRVGPHVGAHLAQLGEHYQVLCVTHLPAVAARAHRHLFVEKLVEGGRTRARVSELTADARVQEIAAMIAGGADEETARAEARRLLGKKEPVVEKGRQGARPPRTRKKRSKSS